MHGQPVRLKRLFRVPTPVSAVRLFEPGSLDLPEGGFLPRGEDS